MTKKNDGRTLTRAEARELVTETALGALETAFEYLLDLHLRFEEKMSQRSTARVARERDLLVKHLRTRAINARLQQRKEKDDGKSE